MHVAQNASMLQEDQESTRD